MQTSAHFHTSSAWKNMDFCMTGHKFFPSNVWQKWNSQNTMNNSTLFLNSLEKVTVLYLTDMAGNASFVILIIVLSFLLFLRNSGYFDCLFSKAK